MPLAPSDSAPFTGPRAAAAPAGRAWPLVTVITVARNAAGTISETIESVLGQAYPRLEHIIIDGDSSDGTQRLVAAYGKRIADFISERDAGIYDAMRKGLERSHGEMVLFMNADDIFGDGQSLAALVSARLDQPAGAPAVCYTDYIKFYPTLGRSLLLRSSDNFAAGMTLCHQTMLVDRAAYDLVGGFDPSFRLAADFDWVVRAKRRGVRFVKVPMKPAAILRGGGASDQHYRLSRGESGRIIRREYGAIACIRYMTRQHWMFLMRALAGKLAALFGQEAAAQLQLFYMRAVRRHRSPGSGT